MFLHGFAGTRAAWDDVRDEGVAAMLPGHERSPARSWDDALDVVARDLVAGEIVVGYSLGARLALGLLARDLVPAAILISVNPGIDDRERKARRKDDARWATVLRVKGTRGFLDAWEAQPLFATQARVDPARRAARRAAREHLDPEWLARSLETMGLAEMPDYRPALAARAGRAHLIAGGDDGKFVAIARATGLPVEVLPDVGHDPTLEAPEALRAAIARALARWPH